MPPPHLTGFFLTDLLLPNILLSSTEFLRRRFLRNVRRSKKMFQLFRVRIVRYVRYVLLLSYTTIDTSHNAFLCLCTIEITKIILPISIKFQLMTSLNPRVSPLVQNLALFYGAGINIKFLTQGKITRIKSPLRRPPRDIFVDHPFLSFERTNDTDRQHNTQRTTVQKPLSVELAK